MKANIILIRIGGAMNLLAAVLHVTFWSTFDWIDELTKLSTINSNIMQMLNLFTIVFFVYVGLLLLVKPRAIVSTLMGKHFLGMLTTMWIARLAMEFYFPEGDLVFAAVLGLVILCFVYPLISSIKVKNRISHDEHFKHTWESHELLEDFEIEDVWELPVKMKPDQSVEEVRQVFAKAIEEISTAGVAGWLFQLRFFLGRVFGWDDEVETINLFPMGSIRERYSRQHGLHRFRVCTSLSDARRGIVRNRK